MCDENDEISAYLAWLSFNLNRIHNCDKMKRVSLILFGMAVLSLCVIVLVSLQTLPLVVTAATPTLPVQVYIIKPVTSQKILPNTPVSAFPLAGNTGNDTIRISACRGEFEPASFVIRPTVNVTGVMIDVTDLKDSNGNTIPKSRVDIRLVKCWYQAGIKSIEKEGGKFLVPELLLKDDSLVKVDQAAQMNYVRITVNGISQYIDITSPNAVFPADAEIHDAKVLQPFDAEANTNKQIWITIQVPKSAKSGVYKGRVTLKDGSQILGVTNIMLTVLPFDLKESVMDYGLYYIGKLRSGKVLVPNSEYKSEGQYAAELQNMKDHGVLYPTLYQYYDTMLGRSLSIRKKVGLPTDKLYALQVNPGSDSNIVSSPTLLNNIAKWKALASQYGFQNLYIYGKDEATGNALLSQRGVMYAAHTAGVKTFVACYKGAADAIGDLLDLPILSGYYKPHEVKKWHQLGKKVFIYGYPQAGVEDAALYRRNYGLGALCNGYDGVMNYAYQREFGQIWNDFDSYAKAFQYRDHVFAYPTSDGVIDTVQWEGFREAIKDVRYLTTLASVTNASAYDSLCGLFSANTDLDSLRLEVVDRIKSSLSTSRKR